MRSKNPVIAIGLDSADPVLLEKWMDQGYLQNLKSLKEKGSYGRLSNHVEYQGETASFMTTEPLWVTFLTGCRPNKTGYWEPVKYCQDSYTVLYDKVNSTYDYEEYAPFFNYINDARTAIFDIPAAVLSENLNGIQVLGWGGHDPFTPSHSKPAELLSELIHSHGEDLIYGKDYGIWWDKEYYHRIQKSLKTTISRRKSICLDLLSRDNWDLFITVFSEMHTAEHDLYGFSESDHPLHETLEKTATGDNPVLKAFQSIDKAIGEILDNAPENAYILCFSLHGMGVNHADLLSMLFLPELLYRFSFPGRAAIGYHPTGTLPGKTLEAPIRHSWLGEAWARNAGTSPLQRFLRPLLPSQLLGYEHLGLACPFSLLKEGDTLAWMPTRWYAPSWPKMKAFALPAFTDGHIRINLQGREVKGIVKPSDYETICSQITDQLYQMQDARTGKPTVKRVIRTRKTPLDNASKLPNADLVVIWNDYPTDVVKISDYGQIGPMPYFRLGGHRPRGFVFGKGPGIKPNSTISHAEVIDLAPTILRLMDFPPPSHFDGKALFNPPVPARND